MNGLSSVRVPQILPGVRAAAKAYEAFILDLWGVIHDGRSAFPHSAETLKKLKDAGAKTMILSNAPRRAQALIEQMERMGLPRDLYGEVMSSGEATRRALIERADPFFARLGEAVYHLGPERDRSVFEDTGLDRVRLRDADFIVATGPTDPAHTLADYEDALRAGAARGLPMVCANPDRVVKRGGKAVMCAGALADRYGELGGAVARRGKPDPAVYKLCIKRLGVDPLRAAVIGDGLETDMCGATDSGLSGLWVTGGIHAETLNGGYGKPADPEAAARLAAAHKVAPTAMLSGFIW